MKLLTKKTITKLPLIILPTIAPLSLISYTVKSNKDQSIYFLNQRFTSLDEATKYYLKTINNDISTSFMVGNLNDAIADSTNQNLNINLLKPYDPSNMNFLYETSSGKLIADQDKALTTYANENNAHQKYTYDGISFFDTINEAKAKRDRQYYNTLQYVNSIAKPSGSASMYFNPTNKADINNLKKELAKELKTNNDLKVISWNQMIKKVKLNAGSGGTWSVGNYLLPQKGFKDTKMKKTSDGALDLQKYLVKADFNNLDEDNPLYTNVFERGFGKKFLALNIMNGEDKAFFEVDKRRNANEKDVNQVIHKIYSSGWWYGEDKSGPKIMPKDAFSEFNGSRVTWIPSLNDKDNYKISGKNSISYPFLTVGEMSNVVTNIEQEEGDKAIEIIKSKGSHFRAKIKKMKGILNRRTEDGINGIVTGFEGALDDLIKTNIQFVNNNINEHWRIEFLKNLNVDIQFKYEDKITQEKVPGGDWQFHTTETINLVFKKNNEEIEITDEAEKRDFVSKVLKQLSSGNEWSWKTLVTYKPQGQTTAIPVYALHDPNKSWFNQDIPKFSEITPENLKTIYNTDFRANNNTDFRANDIKWALMGMKNHKSFKNYNLNFINKVKDLQKKLQEIKTAQSLKEMKKIFYDKIYSLETFDSNNSHFQSRNNLIKNQDFPIDSKESFYWNYVYEFKEYLALMFKAGANKMIIEQLIASFVDPAEYVFLGEMKTWDAKVDNGKKAYPPHAFSALKNFNYYDKFIASFQDFIDGTSAIDPQSTLNEYNKYADLSDLGRIQAIQNKFKPPIRSIVAIYNEYDQVISAKFTATEVLAKTVFDPKSLIKDNIKRQTPFILNPYNLKYGTDETHVASSVHQIYQIKLAHQNIKYFPTYKALYNYVRYFVKQNIQ